MLDLAIETSTARGSIALGNAQVVVQAIDLTPGERASATLGPALTRLGLARLRVRRVIVGLGPGSFSGIRVAIASAQAVAFAQGIEIVGICSAVSIGLQLPHVTHLGVFADAKRREIFCTGFRAGKLEQPTYLLPINDLEDQTARYTLAVSAEPLPGVATRAYPHARDLLAVPDDSPAWVPGPQLEPIYLRGPVQPA